MWHEARARFLIKQQRGRKRRGRFPLECGLDYFYYYWFCQMLPGTSARVQDDWLCVCREEGLLDAATTAPLPPQLSDSRPSFSSPPPLPYDGSIRTHRVALVLFVSATFSSINTTREWHQHDPLFTGHATC